jgi:hypothetical protein
MLDFWKMLANFDLAGAGTRPALIFAAAAALVLIACALVAVRGGSQVRRAIAVSITVVAIATVAAARVLDLMSAGKLEDERRALDARAFELKMRALAPGSTLACLDPTVGEFIQDSCERALFASPEATATAVSYVKAQLSLLSAGSKHAHASGLPYSDALTAFRHSVEADRFGLVAYLFAMQSGCGPDKCDLFDLLRDTTRVRTNLAEHRFESYVRSHTADWPAAAPRLTASNPPPDAPAVVAAKPASNLFFPSASSIPPVNIMTSEPAGAPQLREATASADPAAGTRKTSQGISQAHRPLTVGSGQTRSTPLQIAPPATVESGQVSSTPLQIAPPTQ